MKIKINDPFGFQKAINFEKLDDPKTLKKLSDIFGINDPQTTYKKSVNKLKKEFHLARNRRSSFRKTL